MVIERMTIGHGLAGQSPLQQHPPQPRQPQPQRQPPSQQREQRELTRSGCLDAFPGVSKPHTPLSLPSKIKQDRDGGKGCSSRAHLCEKLCPVLGTLEELVVVLISGVVVCIVLVSLIIVVD